MKKIKIVPLSVSLVLPFLAGGVGSFFTTSSLYPWYSALNKPFFNPPNWIFGPVWTILYILMGISFYLFWTNKGNKKLSGYKFFFAQLILNLLWSIFFFGLKSPPAAFLTILILLTFIILTMKEFRKISKLASYLLAPYVAWVSFASLLNLAIILLN